MSVASLEPVLNAKGRPSLAQSLCEMWAYRGTILAFAEPDVRVKYEQAVPGVAWALLQPLGHLAPEVAE